MNAPAKGNMPSHNRHCLFDFGVKARIYDTWYETPEGRAHDRVQKSDVLRLLRPPRRGHRLLDVGGGTGHWSAFFASVGYLVVSVDVSEEMVRVAKARLASQCLPAVADACELPFRGHSFQAVAAMAVLEFITDVPRALKEMYRCVMPRSSVLIGTLNRLAPINRDRLVMGKQPYASARLLAPEELYELLAPFGRVRMIASPAATGRQGPNVRQAPEVSRTVSNDVSSGRLSGPFIVAEVRTWA